MLAFHISPEKVPQLTESQERDKIEDFLKNLPSHDSFHQELERWKEVSKIKPETTQQLNGIDKVII